MKDASPEMLSIFADAIERPSPDARALFLEVACGTNDELRQRIDALLQAHDKAGGFLQDRPKASRPGETIDQPRSEGAGTMIGPYKLLELIGEGGFGVVFMAEQTQPLRRKVALKVVKPGMDTHQVVARFEAERQALALMDHPNIARVLDAGTTDLGRPYFVMELVRGVPITLFCDEKRLTARERLALFISVCQAIQHAHQKGIIHRDLKPSNVLVTLHDGVPVPKVIDFGVAKALGQQLTEKTLFTGFAQLVGTPLYMSPEQAELSGLDADTRTDIYSLGVLLYELLTGTTPLDKNRLKEVGYDELRRIIREEEPPRPSTRISTLGAAAETVCASRGSEPRKLSALVRGELDWIVMKCLEKDRNRRYESASGLVADVQRYLHDEPVLACPPSAGYRLRKFVRRNKRALATPALLGVVLLVGMLGLAVSYAQIQGEQKQTKAALERERQANEDLERTAYVQRIALAGRELAAGNVGRAEELLDDCPEHLRGWEWQFLKQQRYGRPAVWQHPATVVRVAFSPDAGRLATFCMDGTVAIRDARTGQVIHPLELQTVAKGGVFVRGMAYSPDGKYLAVARHDGSVRVWDAIQGQLLHTLEGHEGPSWQVAFSPDSRTLASGGDDRTVRLWDVTTGQELRQFSGHPAAVKGVAFRPDGRSVLAACDDGTLKEWEASTGSGTFSFHGEMLAFPFSPWFSPDARRLAWACLDGTVKIWDTTTGRLEIDQRYFTLQCTAVAFHPDGTRIAVTGFDGTILLLDAATGREMLTIFAHPSRVAGLDFSPDGSRLASGGYDYTARIWDATSPPSDPLAPYCVTLTGHKEKVSGVAFSPDSRWLASASWDHTVKLWEISENGAITLRYALRGHRSMVANVAFSPDRRTLATAGWDNTVKLWDLQAPSGDSLTEIRSIPLTQRTFSIAFSPDGQLLAMGQQNGIAIYNPATGKPVHPFKRTLAAVPGVAFHPDGRLLVSAGASDPTIKVWDVDKERHRFEIPHHASPNGSVSVSPDGRRLASPGPDHTLKIWDMDWGAKPPTEFRTLRGHTGYAWKVAFSPDGRYLASGSWDSTVKIWEVATGKEVRELRGHAGFILSLAFSPNGRYLATSSGYAGHGEVKIWDAVLWENPTRKEP